MQQDPAKFVPWTVFWAFVTLAVLIIGKVYLSSENNAVRQQASEVAIGRMEAKMDANFDFLRSAWSEIKAKLD